MLPTGEAVTITGEGLKPATSALVRQGESEDADPAAARSSGSSQCAKGDWAITQLPEVEGAFVAIDPRTGAVRAMVGGFDYSKSKFNHVTQAWRQPGSSFKPFIYSASLEKGFTPATVINDAPLFFDAGATGSQPWEPKNYDGTFDGPMSMRRGLAKSKNMISIRILKSIGPPYAQQWITRFGFDAEQAPGLPDDGARRRLGDAAADGAGVQRVRQRRLPRQPDADQQDHRLARASVLNEARCRCSNESMRTIDARNAFVMTSLLQEVTRSGTAAKAQAQLKRADIYGKTGTTNDSLDAWFAGWQKNVVGVVWIGYDQPRKLGDRETGGGLALPVWIDYMSTVLKGVPVQEPAPPGGLVNVGGEWYYEEYARGAGVTSVGLEEQPPTAPSEEERNSDPRPVPQLAALRPAPAQADRIGAACRRARWRSADSTAKNSPPSRLSIQRPPTQRKWIAARRAPPARARAAAAGC